MFLVCSLLGAAVNAATLLANGQLAVLAALRFAVGFLLAGIYPVGMKIAASWYRERLGAVMGVLIGALVLGTALPHGLRALVAGPRQAAGGALAGRGARRLAAGGARAARHGCAGARQSRMRRGAPASRRGRWA